jgi:hypothetical protein
MQNPRKNEGRISECDGGRLPTGVRLAAVRQWESSAVYQNHNGNTGIPVGRGRLFSGLTKHLHARVREVARRGRAVDVYEDGREEDAHVAGGGGDDLVVVAAVNAREVVRLQGHHARQANVVLHVQVRHVVAHTLAGIAVDTFTPSTWHAWGVAAVLGGGGTGSRLQPSVLQQTRLR